MSSREVGPLRLVFDPGQGLIVEGASDWTIRFRITRPGRRLLDRRACLRVRDGLATFVAVS